MISFFSESDMNKNGKIASEYPMWYNPNMIEEIREEIKRDEFMVDNGLVADSKVTAVRNRLVGSKKKLEEIENSKPKLSTEEENKLKKAKDEIAKEIKNALFSRSQMLKGLADGHEEARRMATPTIKVSAEMVDLVKACNIPIYDGKMSRNDAQKAWKIASRYFGDMSNVESLRKD